VPPSRRPSESQCVSWCPYTEWNKNVFRSRQNQSVDRSSFSSVGSLFHARGAATEKALSPFRRRVRGTTRSPHDEARSADRPGGQFSELRLSEIISSVCAIQRYKSVKSVSQLRWMLQGNYLLLLLLEWLRLSCSLSFNSHVSKTILLLLLLLMLSTASEAAVSTPSLNWCRNNLLTLSTCFTIPS